MEKSRPATEEEVNELKKLVEQRTSGYKDFKPAILMAIWVFILAIIFISHDIILWLVISFVLFLLFITIQFIEKTVLTNQLQKDLQDKNVVEFTTTTKQARSGYGIIKEVFVIRHKRYHQIINTPFKKSKYKLGENVNVTAFPNTKIVIKIEKTK